MVDQDQVYTSSFFDRIEDGAMRSARVVVPLVMALVKATSVVDVGCGRGAWLSVFRGAGVTRIAGIDGQYVETSQLLIPRDCFKPADLGRAFEIQGSYDLAVCLEVGEHLPREMGPALIEALTAAAPVVLFSAALPGQGGDYHINEQWPSYWRELFAHRGFTFLDPLRPQMLADRRVEWWYRQNVVLYASEAAFSAWPELKACVVDGAPDIEWIRADIAKRAAQRDTSVRGLSRELYSALGKAARRRMQRPARD
jgi:SAM-dependent methyltransferase